MTANPVDDDPTDEELDRIGASLERFTGKLYDDLTDEDHDRYSAHIRALAALGREANAICDRHPDLILTCRSRADLIGDRWSLACTGVPVAAITAPAWLIAAWRGKWVRA